jgi:hypothetical protein
MAHKTDAEMIQHTRNTARFFVENRQIAWVLLIATVTWGWFGYHSMPQRKDPDIPVRVAVATTPWPGMRAEEVEQQVTRLVEEKIAENQTIHPGTPGDYGIRSVTLPGLSVVYVQLAENVTDTNKQFSDINLKLNWLNNSLPQGAGPVQFLSGFGDTAGADSRCESQGAKISGTARFGSVLPAAIGVAGPGEAGIFAVRAGHAAGWDFSRCGILRRIRLPRAGCEFFADRRANPGLRRRIHPQPAA